MDEEEGIEVRIREAALENAVTHIGNMMIANPSYMPTTDVVVSWADEFHIFLTKEDDLGG